MKVIYSLISVPLALTLAACGGDNSDDAPAGASNLDINTPTTYAFESPFVAATSSVSYPGQTARQVLINDLTSTIKGLADEQTQDVMADLNFYFDFDSVNSGGLNYQFNLGSQPLFQGATYDDISTGKNLSGKIAGNDPSLINGEFFGWDTGSPTTPEALIDHYFSQIHALATDGATDQITLADTSSSAIDVNYVAPTGQDYAQLVQKFLLGAVTYAQGTGDYLKTDFGTNNDAAEIGKSYSSAQHKWDEAFGYFGAARDYNNYTDDEIAAKGGRAEYAQGYYDSNGDGLIDLYSEYNFGNSSNCAKRDRGATVSTNFTKTAFDAFLTGRAILNKNSNLTNDELDALNEAALIASRTWEMCIAATVVHYINDTVSDMDTFVSNGGYANIAAFKDHAKHWSEMKGFALGLQFNPDSPFRADLASLNQLKSLLDLMGDAPVLPDGTQNGIPYSGGVTQYRADLTAARDIMQSIYNFDAQNVADW